MPSTEMMPALRPCERLRPMMYSVSCPGTRFSAIAAMRNVRKCCVPNMVLQEKCYPKVRSSRFSTGVTDRKKMGRARKMQGNRSLRLETFPACHRFLQKAHHPDAVTASLDAAVLAFPQVLEGDDLMTLGAFHHLSRTRTALYCRLFHAVIRWFVFIFRFRLVFPGVGTMPPVQYREQLAEHTPEYVSDNKEHDPEQW